MDGFSNESKEPYDQGKLYSKNGLQRLKSVVYFSCRFA